MEKFGLLVEVLPGKTGLVHTSELDVDRTVSPESFNVGDRLDVKCLEVRSMHLSWQVNSVDILLASKIVPTTTTAFREWKHITALRMLDRLPYTPSSAGPPALRYGILHIAAEDLPTDQQ